MCESKKSIWIYIGIIVAVCIQFAIPFYMMMTRECILRHGERVWIAQGQNYYGGIYHRMEGDYAAIKLSICHVDTTQYCDTNFVTGSRCYALLKTNAEGLQEVDTVFHNHPGYGTVLRGEVYNYYRGSRDDAMTIDYQLNRIYTQQGQADVLNDPDYTYENHSRVYKFPRSAMQVEVAVGKNGIGILTGNYRYPEVIRAMMLTESNDHPFLTYRIENRTDTDYVVPMYNGLPKIEILATASNECQRISTVLWETPMDMPMQNVVVPKGEIYTKVLPFDVTKDFRNIRKNDKECHWQSDLKVRVFTEGESEVCEEVEIFCY